MCRSREENIETEKDAGEERRVFSARCPQLIESFFRQIHVFPKSNLYFWGKRYYLYRCSSERKMWGRIKRNFLTLPTLRCKHETVYGHYMLNTLDFFVGTRNLRGIVNG